MISKIDEIEPYTRQLLLVFKQAMERSPQLASFQKEKIEDRIQEIVDIWTEKQK